MSRSLIFDWIKRIVIAAVYCGAAKPNSKEIERELEHLMSKQLLLCGMIFKLA
jgi:hypothetical protein